jgi:D-apionolactonase
MTTMHTLQAGVFRMKYDRGSLRQIMYGQTEILRMIYFALRDHNWGTIPHRLTNEIIEASGNSFRIGYTCIHSLDGSDIIQWECGLEGRENGDLVFTIDGLTLRDFRKNRAGFCVLHPPKTVCGNPVEIIHDNGSETKTAFPVNISADNPFKNIRAMRWKTGTEWFRLTFEGDVFETEDQRNWCDASFKTFCTPLDIPFPVTIKKDQRIRQTIRFQAENKPEYKDFLPDHVELVPATEFGIIPFIGIAASTETTELSPAQTESLRTLGIHHYRIDIHLSQKDWVSRFSSECVHAYEIAAALEVVLHLTADYKNEIGSFAELSLQNRLRIYKVLLLSDGKQVTSEEVIEFVPTLRQWLPKVKVGVGTDYNFREINSNRFPSLTADFLSYSSHPQEHAFDDLTLVENLEAQRDTARSAQALYPEVPVHISPQTFRKRNNPYATNPAAIIQANELRADPRQTTAFGAAWTFGSLCAWTQAHVESVTLFQSAGKQGVVSSDNEHYPLYDVIRFFAGLSGKRIMILQSSKPLEVQGIAIGENGKLALVNFTDELQEVHCAGRIISLKPGEIALDF